VQLWKSCSKPTHVPRHNDRGKCGRLPWRKNYTSSANMQNRARVSQQPQPRFGSGGEEAWGEGADPTAGVTWESASPSLHSRPGQ
jgi:hypothetical protein